MTTSPYTGSLASLRQVLKMEKGEEPTVEESEMEVASHLEIAHVEAAVAEFPEA